MKNRNKSNLDNGVQVEPLIFSPHSSTIFFSNHIKVTNPTDSAILVSLPAGTDWNSISIDNMQEIIGADLIFTKIWDFEAF